MKLRWIVGAIVALVTAITLSVSIALAFLTSRLRADVVEVASSLASVQLAESIELEIRRARDVTTRALSGELGIAAELAREDIELSHVLREARGLVQSQYELELVERVERGIREVLARRHEALRSGTSSDRAELSRAFDAVLADAQRLSQLNVDQGRAVSSEAIRWAKIGRLIGTAALFLLVVGVPVVLLTATYGVFRPLQALRTTISRFVAGERGVRAALRGPSDLRDVSAGLNEMLDAIAKQRQAEYALLAGIAHDLRNPLQVLKMATATAPPDQPLPPEPRVRKVLEVATRQVARLDRMVEDLLDASRIEAGQLRIRLERRDVREVCTAVVELYAEAAHTHEIALSLPEEPLVLHCDPLRLEQILSNLVANAIKYSPQSRQVSVSARSRNQGIEIAVTDHGIGMTAEQMRHVHEPFWRAESVRATVPGVGLGLATSHALVTAHGGRIEIESRLGGGSTFRVWLPREPPLAPLQVRPTGQEAAARGRSSPSPGTELGAE